MIKSIQQFQTEGGKNKLHALEFPKNTEILKEKKVVDYLYIDADEDHVSLQFYEKRGDLVKLENNRKDNCAIAKLVYVYEGIEMEAPESKMHILILLTKFFSF